MSFAVGGPAFAGFIEVILPETITPAKGRRTMSLSLLSGALSMAVCAGAGATPPVQLLSHADLRGAHATVVDAIDEARQQFEAGRYADVVDTLGASPSSAAALMWRGRAQLELSDFAAAVATLERAVALTPDDSEAHRWLGHAYGEQADRARSWSLARRVRRQFEEAVRLDPTNIAAHRDLLEFHLNAPAIVGGREDRARRELAEIAALDPAAGHLARGAYLEHHGDMAGAAREYGAVISRSTIDNAFEVADFYERRGDALGLRAAIDAATAIDVADPRALYYRGALEVMTHGDLADAESSLGAYLAVPSRSNRPSAVQTHEWLGRLYASTGSVEKAVSEYRNVLALAPGRKSAKEALRRLGQE
jgi:tetratricopeptide (TPR) repeat protein